jgi:hypothetical protein
MFDKVKVRSLINEVFEEEALLIGGLVAVHDLDDDLVWRLIRNLDVIRGKALRRLDDDDSVSGVRDRPHPAVETFLATLRTA